MAITWNRAKQQVASDLGNVKGSDPAAAEASYTGAISTSSVTHPDFTPAIIEDALVLALSKIVEAIASTPLHPGRARYGDVTTALANRATIPRIGAGTSKTIIGVPGAVRDSANSETLLSQTLDAVRSFNRHPTIYGFTAYWYAINSGRIEHTRTTVLIDVCVWERPTSFVGNVDLDDEHEGGLVQLAVRELAPKEGLYAELYASANTQGEAHLAKIRSYVDPALYGKAQAAKSDI